MGSGRRSQGFTINKALARKGSEEIIRGRLRKEAETIMGLRSPRADEAAGSERGRDQGPTAREDGF